MNGSQKQAPDGPAAGPPSSAPSAGGRRTRGGWIPTGTAAERRTAHAERATKRGEQTRRQIVDAARRVFERDGYLDVGVADIVSEAGVARGSFYTYFPTKVDVFRVLADEVGAVMDEALASQPGDEHLDVTDALRRSHHRYMTAYRENAALYALTEQLAHIDAQITERRVTRHRHDLERIGTRIQRWQARGLADPGVDSVATAAALLALTRHLCYWFYVRGDESIYSEDRAEQALNDAWIRTLDLRREPNPDWLP